MIILPVLYWVILTERQLVFPLTPAINLCFPLTSVMTPAHHLILTMTPLQYLTNMCGNGHWLDLKIQLLTIMTELNAHFTILWFSVHVHCSYTPSTKFFSDFTGHPVTRGASGLCVWVQPRHKALVHCRDVFGPRVLSGMGWQEESQTEVQDWCCTLQGQGHFVCVCLLCNITWLCIIFNVTGDSV